MRTLFYQKASQASPRALLHPSILIILAVTWSYRVFPHLLELGVQGSVQLLGQSQYPWWNLILLVCSELWISLCAIHLVAECLQLSIQAVELDMLFADQVNQNTPLQFLVILLGKQSYTCSEFFILIHNLLFYSFCRAGNCYLNHKSRLNTASSLLYIHGLILVCVGIHIAVTLWSFSYLGWSVLLVMHYESLYIIKDALFSWYVTQTQKEPSVDTGVKIAIAENACKLLQWTHIALSFSDITPTNPGNIFLFLKIQQHFLTLSGTVKKYRNYMRTLQQFLKKYPSLGSAELAQLTEKNCCICREPLDGQCHSLSCKHCFHLVCICKWMSTKREKVCPLCGQSYLPDNEEFTKIVNFLSGFEEVDNSLESEVRRIQNIFPQIPDETIRRLLVETGNIDATIEVLMQQVLNQ